MRQLYFWILLAAVLAIPLSIIIPRWSYYTVPYYTESTFKGYERAFNTSQYRVKNPGIIPDETVFSYASGAYLRGMDPILVNSEHTPLGKYFIAASIYVLHNDRFPTIIFAFLTGLSIWLIGRQVFGNGTIALIPLLIVTFDKLFMNQLITAPLLDIIQLPFIFFTILAFLHEEKIERYLWTAVSLGVVIATKTIVPGIILAGCIGIYLLLKRDIKGIIRFCMWLPVSFLILLISYTRTFMSGYTFWEFLKFQKWIFMYQGSKLIYPFSSLRLLVFNQWQTWWAGNKVIPVNDWSVLWPLSTVGSFVAGIWVLIRNKWRNPKNDPLVLLLLWILAYHALLSLGVVSSRFFIPLLPAQYIVFVFAILFVIKRLGTLKNILVLIVPLVWFLLVPQYIHAEYILPYPSYMPGNKLYTVSKVFDCVKAYWYWGDVGAFRYHLGLSDKYLVEAKILFEYKQYLLGSNAINHSDKEFLAVSGFLQLAKRNGKDITVLKQTLLDASVAHQAVITQLLVETPVSFTWTPEKVAASELELHTMLQSAMSVRKSAALKASSL